MASITDGLRKSAADASPERPGSTKQELASRRLTVINAVNIAMRDLALQIPDQAPGIASRALPQDKFFIPKDHTPRTTDPDNLRQQQIDSAKMAVEQARQNNPGSQL